MPHFPCHVHLVPTLMTTKRSTSSSPVKDIDKASIAEAVAKRQETTGAEADVEYGEERDLRQNFRRLIDPGIVRPNSKESVISSLTILSTIAGNLLREPDNPKYQRFKPTNTIIKNNLVEVPGALEYAVAMGFRAEVEHFQPFYTHAKKYIRELRVGAAIIAETLERENVKTQRSLQNSAAEKEARKGVAEKIKMNYIDDRKEKRLRDEMERQRRLAILEQAQHRAQSEAASESSNRGLVSSGGNDAMPRAGTGIAGHGAFLEGEDQDSGDISGSETESER